MQLTRNIVEGMNLIEFQNSKIELAKLVLDIEDETLLQKVLGCLVEGKIDLINKPTSKMKEDRQYKRTYQKEDVLRGGIEDIKEGRSISVNEFAIKLSLTN